jgi:hypothetical protein
VQPLVRLMFPSAEDGPKVTLSGPLVTLVTSGTIRRDEQDEETDARVIASRAETRHDQVIESGLSRSG